MENQEPISKPETSENCGHSGGRRPSPCSALAAALHLVKCSPRKSEDAQVWWDAACKMTKHCRGLEDVTEAAARIIAEQLLETAESAQSLMTYATAWHRSKKQDAAVKRWEDALSSLPNGPSDSVG